MNYYVFRIDEHNSTLRKELFTCNRLRQGWGLSGMDIRCDFDSFKNSWIKTWGDDGDYIYRKYTNLLNMRRMEKDDIIVIPKISKEDESGYRVFSIVRCNENPYSFEPLSNQGGDFGHIISVTPIVSCYYDCDSDTRTISAKFTSYQSAVNNVYNEDFIEAVNRIISNSNTINYGIISTSISSIAVPTSKPFKTYLGEILNIINSWSPNHLEGIITELFTKNGFFKTRNNYYDKAGGDIDIVFNYRSDNLLLSDILSFANTVDAPEIRVQAKKKSGRDENDKEGIQQLLLMKDDKPSINIVVNTAEEFSDEARELANKNQVILINGYQFAALLVKYGIDITESLML